MKSKKQWSEFIECNENWETVSVMTNVNFRVQNLKGTQVYKLEVLQYDEYITESLKWYRRGDYFIDSDAMEGVFTAQFETKTSLINLLWKAERGL